MKRKENMSKRSVGANHLEYLLANDVESGLKSSVVKSNFIPLPSGTFIA